MKISTIEQLSVFIENRSGELYAITSLLEKENVSIISIMLSDSSEFGLLRLLTNEIERAKEVLLKQGFMAQSSKVIGVKIENKIGSFNEVVKVLAKHNIEILYTYTVNEKGEGLFIFKIDDSKLQNAIDLLKDSNISLISNKDL